MKRALAAAALIAAFAVPGIANAASAIATTDVNLRAGPSTSYPVVDVVRNGTNIRVFGCLENESWCDVAYGGQRGWLSSNYIAYLQGGQRYTDNVRRRLNAPVVTFSFGSYWGDHYRSRGFYRDRARFEHHDRRGGHDRRDGRWDRDHDRRDGRWDRRDDRNDRRDARRDVREERRDVRDARRDLRQARRNGENIRDERRDLRQERRDLRDARGDLRRERRD